MPRNESYNTKAKLEILAYLNKCSNTVSVADILKHLKENGILVNQTTVYRCLDKLCSDHTIIKYVSSKGKKAVYQLSEKSGQCAEHLHLKCIYCGKIIHLDCSCMDNFKSHLQNCHDFMLQCEGAMLYGICTNCLNKENK